MKRRWGQCTIKRATGSVLEFDGSGLGSSNDDIYFIGRATDSMYEFGGRGSGSHRDSRFGSELEGSKGVEYEHEHQMVYMVNGRIGAHTTSTFVILIIRR